MLFTVYNSRHSRILIYFAEFLNIVAFVEFSSAPRERESVEIWLRPLGNGAYEACLLLLCPRVKVA